MNVQNADERAAQKTDGKTGEAAAILQVKRFVFPRRVAYHETDAMGVVHHSNHVKYFEEARVAWLREKGMMAIHAPYGPYTFAVLELQNRYYKMARFDDELEVLVQSRLKGARILFQYALWSRRLNAFIADGTTTLIPLNENMKPTKLPAEIAEMYSSEEWEEVWPPKVPMGPSVPDRVS